MSRISPEKEIPIAHKDEIELGKDKKSHEIPSEDS